MTLTELEQLVRLLRSLGVTKYAADNVHIELGLLPAAADQELPRPEMPRMNEDLAAAMKRLDPLYSDPSLFEIKS